MKIGSVKAALMLSVFLIALLPFGVQASDIAWTIDDLPIHSVDNNVYSRVQMAQMILATLKKHDLPPVYGFVNGTTVENHSEGVDVLNAWTAASQPIGNHTYSHDDLSKMTLKEYLSDIDRNEDVLKMFSNGMDFKIFRYPFLKEGETKEKREGIRSHLSQNGYKIAQVTIDYWDFQWNRPVARCLAKGDTQALEELRKLYVEAAVNELEFSEEFSLRIFGRQIKHIALTHIGVATALFLDDALSAYQSRSVRFVSLPDAMADELYDTDTGIISKNGPNFLDQMARVKKVGYPPRQELPLEKLRKMCL